jgi:hypothetical protein
METHFTTDREDNSCPLPHPIVLPPGETHQVAGGLNPQPLPPCIEHRIEIE